jgi:hypothetical protein
MAISKASLHLTLPWIAHQDDGGNLQYVVQLIVTDSHGAASTPDSITISISTGNSAPVANAISHLIRYVIQ